MKKHSGTVAFVLSVVMLVSLLSSMHLSRPADVQAFYGFTDTPTPGEPAPPEDTPVPPTAAPPEDTPAPPDDTPEPPADTPVPPAETRAPNPNRTRRLPENTPVPEETPEVAVESPTPTLSVTPGIPITGRTLSAEALLWFGLIAGIVAIALLLSRRRAT